MSARASTVSRALFAGFLLWLYVGDVVRWLRLQTAAVAVMVDAPSLPLALVGSAVALAFLAVVLSSLRPKPFVPARPARWISAAAVVLVFVDFMGISSRRDLSYPEDALVGAANIIATIGNEASGTDVVARSPALFDEALSRFSDVPIFVNGERVARWQLQLREGCAGPAADPQGAAPGTVVYCVASDRRQAWVNVVATARAKPFGDAAMTGVDGIWVGHVEVATAAAAPVEQPVWDTPTPE